MANIFITKLYRKETSDPVAVERGASTVVTTLAGGGDRKMGTNLKSNGLADGDATCAVGGVAATVAVPATSVRKGRRHMGQADAWPHLTKAAKQAQCVADPQHSESSAGDVLPSRHR